MEPPVRMAHGDVPTLAARPNRSSAEDATCASTIADTQRPSFAAISVADQQAKEDSLARKTEHAMKLSTILRSFASGTVAAECSAEWTIW